MARNVYLTEDNVDVVDEVIENVFEKVGIKLNTKELVETVFQDPEPLTQLILQNIRKRFVAVS